jgi:hypothetical protein
MNTTSIDESEGQHPSTFYLYPTQLFYLACSLSHLYGRGLSLKFLNLHSKLSKNCTLWLKAALRRWFGPQIA